MTEFYTIYMRFLGKITDDSFLEITPEETMSIMQDLLLDSIPEFDFPRKNLNDFDLEYAHEEEGLSVHGKFNEELDFEEIDILAEIMLWNWYRTQLANTKLLQLRYSTSDFKQTSQASHMQKLQAVTNEQRKTVFRRLRLYSRRIVDKETGKYTPNYDWMKPIERKYHSFLTSVGEC